MNIVDPLFPYDIKTQNQIESFYNKIATKVGKRDKFIYTQSEDGNLETYDKKTNELTSSIPLYYYRYYTKDELQLLETERKDSIIAIEQQIDVTRSLLRKAYEEYKTTQNYTNFLKYNEEMKILELKKLLFRSPVRDIKTIQSVETRDIDFEKQYEIRKTKDVFVNIYREYPLWKLYGKYTDSKEVLEASIQNQTVLKEGEVFLKNGKIARIFNNVSEDDVNSFLSIFKLQDFIYNNVKYSSPYQAFEATRLETLDYGDLRNQIMKSKNIKYIKVIASKIKKALPNTKDIWRDILINFYKQNQNQMKLLLNTKNTILVFANNIPYLGGIGYDAPEISTDDNSSKENKVQLWNSIIDPKLWKTLKINDVIITPNIVGNTLMDIRNEMKESISEDQEQIGGEIKESYRTDEEKEMKKKAAIINYMKKKNLK